jgi:hypothetical protein
MLLPPEVTRAVVEAELEAIDAWVARWKWRVEVDLESLLLRFATTHPRDGKPLHLDADMTDYRALPPAWRFTRPDGTTDRTAWPAPGHGPRGSVLHSHPIICAPWNRLAYQELGGVHDDWNGPSNWLNVAGHTRATTVPDMLSVIRANLSDSDGWMT